MKKILISALIIASFATECIAAVSYNKYQTTEGAKFDLGQKVQTQISQENTVFSNQQENQNEEEEVENSTLSKFSLTKDLQYKYRDITKSSKIIEACELLKNGAGDFSYQSIHGRNKTNTSIIIDFVNFSNDDEHSEDDAYGKFYGKKYYIHINSKFQDAPAAALSPIIAREALVSKEKDETDIEAATQLQIAVWTEMLRKQPYLEGSQNKLVKIQNRLKENGDISEYGSFLTEMNNKPSKPSKSKENRDSVNRSFTSGHATQDADNFKKQEEAEKISSEILSYDSKALEKKYKKVTKEERIMEALDLLSDTVGKFSHDAILGKNLTHRPITIKFRNLSEINPKYATFDALGWRQAGKLNIYINSKHADAPAAAIAAILSHEALHQDEYDSLNEETYAWTMEASVWAQLCDKNPEVSDVAHPLVTRENLLKKLLEKGNYTSKYIKKSVFSNPSYSNLPVRSPGFEDDF